jgi:transcriptional regulator with XRE-family HTH domain
MEISLAGSIRTPFGEVELIPQDRSLLQASSPEPLRYGNLMIDLWALFEQTGGTWAVSEVATPVLSLAGRSALRSSMLGASIRSEIIKTVAELAGEWAVAHPEAFACAGAEAFELDKEGLHRELGTLKESLTSSAHAIDSMRSMASPESDARLREYLDRMRKMASDVPAMQEIARRIAYPEERAHLPDELLRLAFDGPTIKGKPNDRREASGLGAVASIQSAEGSSGDGASPATIEETLGQVLKTGREKIGLSQNELAVKLGIAADAVMQLESDRGARPSFPLLSRAANVMGLEKDRLFQLAETRTKPAGGAAKVVPYAKSIGTVWGKLARDRGLRDRYNITPHELRALTRVNLMGKATDTEALLFILESMRNAEKDTDDTDDE